MRVGIDPFMATDASRGSASSTIGVPTIAPETERNATGRTWPTSWWAGSSIGQMNCVAAAPSATAASVASAALQARRSGAARRSMAKSAQPGTTPNPAISIRHAQ